MSVQLALGAVVGAVALLSGGVAYVLQGEHSDNFRLVEHDKSWLGYLPGESADLEFEIGSLTKESLADVTVRRVDLLDRTHTRLDDDGGSSDGLSLCFGDTVEDALKVCPGAIPLGRIDRDVELPWVVQVGDPHGVDWRARLSTPTPTLADVDYLD